MTTTPDTALDADPARRTTTGKISRRRLMSRISIQSKLLVMLLVTSILSAAVVGFIGYQSGRDSLRASVFDRLTETRQAQTRQLQSQFSDLKNSLVVYSRGSTTTQAIQAFTTGFDELQTSTITPEQQRSLVDYYINQFATAEAEQMGEEVDISAVLPKTNTERYLQAHYTAPFDDWDASIRFDNAGDGSAWTAANARFNDFFREIVTRFEYEDDLMRSDSRLFLEDPEAYKRDVVEVGTPGHHYRR